MPISGSEFILAQAQWVLPVLFVLGFCFVFAGLPSLVSLVLSFTRHRIYAPNFAITAVIVSFTTICWMIFAENGANDEVYLLLSSPMFASGIALFIATKSIRNE